MSVRLLMIEKLANERASCAVITKFSNFKFSVISNLNQLALFNEKNAFHHDDCAHLLAINNFLLLSYRILNPHYMYLNQTTIIHVPVYHVLKTIYQCLFT